MLKKDDFLRLSLFIGMYLKLINTALAKVSMLVYSPTLTRTSK